MNANLCKNKCLICNLCKRFLLVFFLGPFHGCCGLFIVFHRMCPFLGDLDLSLMASINFLFNYLVHIIFVVDL